MGETVVHGAHIGKGAACITHSKTRSWVSLEKEQPGIFLIGIGCLFLLGVNIVENRLASQSPLLQSVDDLNGLVRVNVAVIGQPQVPQGFAAPVACIHRKKQAAIVVKHRVIHDCLDGGIYGKLRLHGRSSLFLLAGRHGMAFSAAGKRQRQYKCACSQYFADHHFSFFLPEKRRRPIPP